MPVHGDRSDNKRSSERNVALVQVQIAAQARNQQWHEFLCRKRDELQARIRQQGYSGYSHSSQNSQKTQRQQRDSDLAEGKGAGAQREIAAPQRSSPRWGVPTAAPTEVSALEVAVEQASASEDIANMGTIGTGDRDVKGQG